jgi:hypothetical protein
MKEKIINCLLKIHFFNYFTYLFFSCFIILIVFIFMFFICIYYGLKAFFNEFWYNFSKIYRTIRFMSPKELKNKKRKK